MWVDPDTFFRLTNGGEEARLGGVMMNPNELGMLAGNVIKLRNYSFCFHADFAD
jgi:hypothetical protein